MSASPEAVVADIQAAAPAVEATAAVAGVVSGQPEIAPIADASIMLGLALAQVYAQMEMKNQPLPSVAAQAALGVSLGAELRAFQAAK